MTYLSLILFGVLPVGLTLLSPTPARAQGAGRTFTWTGSAGSNWETNGNWDSNLYADSPTTAVSFLAGVANALSLLNASHSVYGITFGYNGSNAATNFTIRGSNSANALNVYDGGITNNTTLTQTIDASVNIRATQFFSTVSGGTLQFTGSSNQINLLGNTLLVAGGGNTNIASRIVSTGGAGGTLFKTGAGTLTLTNTDNSFTGNIEIEQGTIVAGASQTTENPATSVLGSTMTSSRTITVGDGTNGGTLNLAASRIFGTGNSNPQVGITVNKGATLTNSGNQFNILPNLTLKGGTLTGNGGLSASQQMYSFAFGSVTVTGSGPSFISGSGTNSGYHLGGSTTFNVSKTGSYFYDLLVSGNLIDNFDSNGPGSLVKTGAGTMVLAGINTYTGSTIVNQGTLSVGSSASSGYTSSLGSGTGNVTINSGGTLSFDHSSSAGSVNITNNDGGVLTFGASSSAGNARITNNSGGTLLFINYNPDPDGGYAGSATINNSGTVRFNYDQYYPGNLHNSSAQKAKITNNSGGVITFEGHTTAASATITNNSGGAINFTKDSAMDSAAITNNAFVNFYDDSSAGSGTITNNGLLNFYGNSAAGSATIRNNGALYVFDHTNGLSIGSLSGAGDVRIDGFTLTLGSLNRNDTISGIIGGAAGAPPVSGSVIKTGSGTLTLTGNNTYSGGTTLSGGTLVARGSALGTGAVTINNGRTLAVGQAANATRTSLAGGPQSLSLSSLVVSSAGNSFNPFLTFNLFGGGVSDTLFLTGSGTALSFSSANGSGPQFIVGFASGTGALISGGTYTLMTFSNSSASVTSGFDLSDANNSFAARRTLNLDNTNGTFSWTKSSGGSITGLQYTFISSSDTPEPGTLPLLGMGIVGGLGIVAALKRHKVTK